MSKETNRLKRTHFRLKSDLPAPTRIICICGKDVHPNHHRANTTDIMDHVTCPSCLEILQRENWYCPEHKFINDMNVTNDETCANCGRSVA